MEEKNTSVFYNALIWGVIMGLISIIFSVILYTTGQSLNRTLSMVGSILVTFGVLAFAVYSYRDKVLDGIMPFGKAFTFGVLVVVFAAVIGQIYSYLMFTVIDPGLQDRIMELAMEKMAEKGLPEDQIDQAMNISRRFMNPVFMAISGLISAVFFGVLLSLITAAVFKRESPEGIG